MSFAVKPVPAQIPARSMPVTGLADLTNESRVIATPWSRMVRGIGLGQYPIDYDPAIAAQLRGTFEHLGLKVTDSNSYTLFARHLTDLILRTEEPRARLSRAELEGALGLVIDAVRAEPNAYHRVVAGCILMDAVAKLGLDPHLLMNEASDFPGEVLDTVNRIQPDQIKDENRGRHGQYEKLSAYTAVFLAFGQLGLRERLITGSDNHIHAALELLDDVPAPFFRGRGGSMLMSVVSLLGADDIMLDGNRDYLAEVLTYLDRAGELNLPPSFPGRMTPAFGLVYPLLTMLNAIAMSGRPEYLSYGCDRLAEAKDLLGQITAVERTHMGLYYILALHNLGRLEDQVPDLDAFVEGIVSQWPHVNPGADFFLNGISYPYMIETAMICGRPDLITDEALDRLVDSFPGLDRTALDRANRPYPVSYVLNMLGEIGEAERLFTPRAAYGGNSAISWVVDHLSENGRAEGSRLHMLDHALISYALRLRGTGRGETEMFRNFAFPAPAGPSSPRS